MKQDLFIHFELKGDLEEQILYLAYNSFAKQKLSSVIMPNSF